MGAFRAAANAGRPVEQRCDRRDGSGPARCAQRNFDIAVAWFAQGLADSRRTGYQREHDMGKQQDGDSQRDDHTRELKDRYGHGEGGYDREAYPQGGHGEDGPAQGGYGRGISGAGRRDEERDAGWPEGAGPHGGERGPLGHRAAGEGRGLDAPQGEDPSAPSGLLAGGADQDVRSGGQHHGESGRSRDAAADAPSTTASGRTRGSRPAGEAPG